MTIWAWRTCQTQTPNSINERNMCIPVRRPRANIVYKKFLFIFWRVEYLANCTMDYQDSWAMRNLICYWGVLLYKLRFKFRIWVRDDKVQLTALTLSYVCHLVQEQGFETVLLSYKTVCISIAFLFILCSLITVTF